MTTLLLIALLILAPTTVFAQTASPASGLQPTSGANPPTDRFQDFLDRAVLSPGPYVLALGGGIIDEISGMPEEWTGSSGFAKRNLARVGSGRRDRFRSHASHLLLSSCTSTKSNRVRALHSSGVGFASIASAKEEKT